MQGTTFSALTLVVLMVLGIFSFLLPVASALSYDILRVSSPSLRNISGEKIDIVEIGQQAVIRISIHNNLGQEQPFVILTEVRDDNGITRYLSWQSGIAAANGNYTMETVWMPDIEGTNHEIRSFAISSIQNPSVLSAVASSGTVKVAETAGTLLL